MLYFLIYVTHHGEINCRVYFSAYTFLSSTWFLSMIQTLVFTRILSYLLLYTVVSHVPHWHICLYGYSLFANSKWNNLLLWLHTLLSRPWLGCKHWLRLYLWLGSSPLTERQPAQFHHTMKSASARVLHMVQRYRVRYCCCSVVPAGFPWANLQNITGIIAL